MTGFKAVPPEGDGCIAVAAMTDWHCLQRAVHLSGASAVLRRRPAQASACQLSARGSAKLMARAPLPRHVVLRGFRPLLRVVGPSRALRLLPASIQGAGKVDAVNYIWGASDSRAYPSA